MQPDLFIPDMSILIQKCHPYTGDLNLETPGDSNDAFLHRGDVVGGSHQAILCLVC